mmetsp:Transcript_27395/g.78937  ORF Transcript_27395/g.78937 Transcript_27395/m.78937 type:complete len:211 (+) Transcript_27395:798-1430(+)
MFSSEMSRCPTLHRCRCATASNNCDTNSRTRSSPIRASDNCTTLNNSASQCSVANQVYRSSRKQPTSLTTESHAPWWFRYVYVPISVKASSVSRDSMRSLRGNLRQASTLEFSILFMTTAVNPPPACSILCSCTFPWIASAMPLIFFDGGVRKSYFTNVWKYHRSESRTSSGFGTSAPGGGAALLAAPPEEADARPPLLDEAGTAPSPAE